MNGHRQMSITTRMLGCARVKLKTFIVTRRKSRYKNKKLISTLDHISTSVRQQWTKKLCAREQTKVDRTIMKRTIVVCLAIVGLVAPVYTAPQELPENFAGCLNSLDCPAGYCCMLVPMRYSTPSCVLKRQVGDICRPNNEPVNATLNYPGGILLEVTNVYYAVCPCDSAFTCDRKTGVCTSEYGPVEGVLID